MKRKAREEYTLGMEAMDMDNFGFEEVILKYVVVLDTPVTYFSDMIFGKTNLKRDLFQHFGTDTEMSQVRAARRRKGGLNAKSVADA